MLLYALRRLLQASALVVLLPPPRRLVILVVNGVEVDVRRHADGGAAQTGGRYDRQRYADV